VTLKDLLSDLQHHREALLDGRGDAGGHLRSGVPVMGAHGAAALLAGTAGGLVPHHLVDDPGGDAGVLQPGRKGVAEVVGAMQIHGLQQRVAGRGQRPPTLLTVLTSAGDQLGRDEFAQGDLDRGWPDGPTVVGECGGELVKGLRTASSERLEDAGGGGPQVANGVG
jgi:hypothetical protein